MNKSIEEPKLGHYYLPEFLPFIYCFACLVIVLEYSKEAKKIYEEIKRYWELPGCKSLVKRTEEKVKDKKKLVNDILAASGISKNEDNTMKMEKAPALVGGLKDVISQYAYIEEVQLLFNRGTKGDLEKVIKKIDELIKIGFNRESEKSKGIYKLTSETSGTLAETICLYSLYEIRRINLTLLGKLPAIIKRKKTITFEDLIENRAKRRSHEKLSHEYIKGGFRLKDEYSIAQKAKMWYGSRVIYSGPEEFCRESLLKNELDNVRSTVSHQIAEIDEAMGYQRAK